MDDCTNYILCSYQDPPVVVPCEEAPNIYFNGETCVSDESQCCTTIACSPYCGEGQLSAHVEDPCDCRSYYYCDDEYVVPVYKSFCDNNEVFDPSTGHCQEGIYCESICSYVMCNPNQVTSTLSPGGTPTSSVKNGICVIPDDSDCLSYTEPTKIPDPFDCHNFYECYDEALMEPTPYYCGDDMYFDEEIGDCASETVFGHCTDTCIVRHKCSSNDCSDPTVTSYPDLRNCRNYYICDADGNSLATSCDYTHRFFDGEGCTSDESECCIHTMCVPYCGFGATVPFMNVPDPCDCHSYYLCDAEGSVPTFKGTCPNNDVFDGNGCNSTIPCEPYCSLEQCLLTQE